MVGCVNKVRSPSYVYLITSVTGNQSLNINLIYTQSDSKSVSAESWNILALI